MLAGCETHLLDFHSLRHGCLSDHALLMPDFQATVEGAWRRRLAFLETVDAIFTSESSVSEPTQMGSSVAETGKLIVIIYIALLGWE